MNATYPANEIILTKSKNKAILHTVLALVFAALFVVALAVKNDEKLVFEIAWHSEEQYKTVMGVLKVLMVLFGALAVVMTVLAIVSAIAKARYQSSFVTLTDDGVTGNCFPSKNASAVPFSIPYSEIVNVVGVDGDNLNLRITTRGAVISCLAIRTAPAVAKRILLKMEEQKTACFAPSVVGMPATAPMAAAVPQRERYCGKCGTKIRDGAMFCHECGAGIS